MIQHYEIFSHQNSKIRPLTKNLCVDESVAYLPKTCIHLYYHCVRVFGKTRKDKIYNAQNRRSIEISNRLFETYKNNVTPHGKHMF